MTGRVVLIGAGPGDPELITVKGARALGEADVVIFDRLVAPALLDLCRPEAERLYVGKEPGRAAVPQEPQSFSLTREVCKRRRLRSCSGSRRRVSPSYG